MPARLTRVLLPGACLVLFVACSSGTESSGGGSPPPPANVSIVPAASAKGFQAYAPDTFSVHLNGAAQVRVVWRNDDTTSNAAHTVTDSTAAAQFNRTLAAGDTASVSFTSAGDYPYKCSIHPGMRGLVKVLP